MGLDKFWLIFTKAIMGKGRLTEVCSKGRVRQLTSEGVKFFDVLFSYFDFSLFLFIKLVQALYLLFNIFLWPFW
jgi:hypothetical protein